MNSFLIALQFITIIPVKKELNYSEKNIANSMLYYPLIGSLIGGILVLMNMLTTYLFSDLISNSLILIAFVTLSGGIHLDGLADSFDGLFGGKGKKKILKIMQDSNIGIYGISAVVLLLILKFSLLVELPAGQRNIFLLITPTISRWSMVMVIHLFPYAKKEGFGKAFKLYQKKSQIWIASLWTLLLSFILFFLEGIFILLVSFIVIWIFGSYLTKKIGGLTGDNYGALNEIMEVLILMLLIILN